MTVRFVAVALFALTGTALAASPLYAGSINVLQPTDDVLQECIGVRAGDSSSAWQGHVLWNFGRLTWLVDPRGKTDLILVCVDDVDQPSAMSGGLQMIAALSWTMGAMAAPRIKGNAGPQPDTAGALSAAGEFLDALDVVAGLPIAGPRVSWPAFDDPFLPGALGDAGPFSITASALAAGGEPPIVLDPGEWDGGFDDLAPVPEPGTWLLMGTGLAAAWKAARRRK